MATISTAVLLAAGAATRLRPLTNETPKCLLEVGGVPILRRAIDNLVACGISELVLVTGFHAEKIQAAVGAWFPSLQVTWLHNEVWATTNNSASLLLARGAVDGRDFVLLDSDIVFERGVLDALLASPHGDALALRAGAVGAEEIKVELDDRGRVRVIGKTIAPAKAAGESIGIERFSPAGGREMFVHLADRVTQKGLVNEWYEASWQQWFDAGGAMYAVGVGDAYCAEIDTVEDLEAVGRAIAARTKG
jgi:choline kinase